MATSDLVSVRGQVMEYTYVPTGIKGEMVRSGVDCHWKGQYIAYYIVVLWDTLKDESYRFNLISN